MYEADLRRGAAPSIEALARGWEGRDRDLLLRHLLELEADYRGQKDPPTPTPSAAAATIGITLPSGDRFHVVREIGRGGMGVVYEAFDRAFGRRVALKLLPGSMQADAAHVARFRREARAAARLHHENIVPVFEVGAGDTGTASWYSMLLVDGRSLDQVLALTGRANTAAPDSVAGSGEGSDPDAPHRVDRDFCESWHRHRPRYFINVARIGVQVADALAYAHTEGVVHRDVKPPNLLLDGSGTVWVTDFGLAKTEVTDITKAGDVLGTLRYMAPERFAGRSDARADIYGLGIVLFELLTLQRAFGDGDSATVIGRIQQAAVPRPTDVDPSIPRDLARVVEKAIARDPDQRYSTAGELGADLRRFLDGRPVTAERVSPLRAFGLWARRHGSLAFGIGVASLVVVALLAGTIGVASSFRRERDREKALRQESERTRIALSSAMYAREVFLAGIDVREVGGRARMRSKLDAAAALAASAGLPRGWEWFWLDGVAWGERLTRDEPATRPPLPVLPIRPAAADAAVASPDGRLEAVIAPDDSIHLVDRSTHATLRVLSGHTRMVRCVAWHPREARLASIGDDAFVRLWDSESGAELLALVLPASGVSVAWSEDGRELTARCDDGALRHWRAPPPK